MKRAGATLFTLLGALAASGCQTTDQSSLLFVQVAQSGALEAVNGSADDYTLELSGLHPEVIYFTDRPQRGAGSVTTEEFLDAWNRGGDSFADDPPNVAVAMQGRDDMLILEISQPVRQGDTLRYNARMLDDLPSYALGATSRPAELPRNLGRVVLFIDNFNQMNGLRDPMNRPDNFGRESFGGNDPMNRPDNFGRESFGGNDPMNRRDNFGR